MRTRDPLKHIVEGDIVKVYKYSQGKEVEIIMDRDVFEEIEKNQYVLSVVSKNYVSVTKRRKKEYVFRMLLHRFAMGAGPSQSGSDDTIDHRDGNTLNNLRSNLRVATHQQQQWNKRVPKNNKTGVKGVRLDKATGLYKGTVQYKKKKYHCGYHTTIEEATKVVEAKRAELHKEYGASH
jgi:hypothetical protein